MGREYERDESGRFAGDGEGVNDAHDHLLSEHSKDKLNTTSIHALGETAKAERSGTEGSHKFAQDAHYTARYNAKEPQVKAAHKDMEEYHRQEARNAGRMKLWAKARGE